MASPADEYATNGTLRQDIDSLYNRIDADKDGFLNVEEVVALFRQLAPNEDRRSSYNAAMEALMLSDANADAVFSISEFVQLLTSVSEAAGVPLATTVDCLLSVTQPLQSEPTTPDAASTQRRLPAAAVSQYSDKAAGDDDQLLDSKLRELFHAWDKSGDGDVSFDELCQGLARFKPHLRKQDLTAVISEAASILAKHDSDGDRRLQYDEFTTFLTRYMHAAGYNLVEVGDELMSIAHRPDSRKLQAVLDSAQPQIDNILS